MRAAGTGRGRGSLDCAGRVGAVGRPERDGTGTVQGCARDYVDALTGKRHAAVAQAWAREVVGRPEVEAELRTFAAAPQRLGEDGRATWSERLWLADMSRAS